VTVQQITISLLNCLFGYIAKKDDGESLACERFFPPFDLRYDCKLAMVPEGRHIMATFRRRQFSREQRICLIWIPAPVARSNVPKGRMWSMSRGPMGCRAFCTTRSRNWRRPLLDAMPRRKRRVTSKRPMTPDGSVAFRLTGPQSDNRPVAS